MKKPITISNDWYMRWNFIRIYEILKNNVLVFGSEMFTSRRLNFLLIQRAMENKQNEPQEGEIFLNKIEPPIDWLKIKPPV